MEIILIPLLQVINFILNLYIWAIIIYCLLNLFISLQIVNPYSQFVQTLAQFLARLIEPVLLRIRKVIPLIGTIDLSPLVLILIIYFFQAVVGNLMIRLF